MSKNFSPVLLSILSFSSISICLNSPVKADELNNLEEEFKAIKEICAPLKGRENSLCQITGIYLGSNRFVNLGQNTTSAPQKVVASLGNSCKRIVPDLLKSPGSARFPVNPQTTEIFRGMYVVNGKVDSQNSYGALLRASYFCYLRHIPKKGIEALGAEILEPRR